MYVYLAHFWRLTHLHSACERASFSSLIVLLEDDAKFESVLPVLSWVFVVILNLLNIPAIHCISDEQLGSLVWWPCAPAGRELLQSLLAEAPECCTLKHSPEPGSGGQLRVTGHDFPLRQCQLPASWKQVSDRSCNAFSRSLDLGWSKEWGFFWEIECLDNLIIIIIN